MKRRAYRRTPAGDTRGERALRAVCESLGIDATRTQELRGEEMRLFQWMWTEEMMRLARTESGPFPWQPEWDRETQGGPVYDFQRRGNRDKDRSAAA